MNCTGDIKDLVAALAKAQGEIKNPQKNKKVTVQTRTGGSYEFSYADLTAIIDAVKKPLSDNGLAYVQTLSQNSDGKYQLTTTLMHSSGQWIESNTPLFVGEAQNQAFGSALTFMKRYALAAMLGISADSDDDANTADGNAAQVQDRAPKKPAANPLASRAPQAAQTEPVAPHAIAVLPTVDGKASEWTAWARSFIEAVRASDSPEIAEQWRNLNQVHVHSLQKIAPGIYKRVCTVLEDYFPNGVAM